MHALLTWHDLGGSGRMLPLEALRSLLRPFLTPKNSRMCSLICIYIGASREPHTSELNQRFFIYICCRYILYVWLDCN